MNAIAIAVFFASSAGYLYLMSALGKRLGRSREESSLPIAALPSPVRAPFDEGPPAAQVPPLDVPATDVISA